MGKSGLIIFLIYLIVGLYLINVPFEFIKMPAFILGIQDWIIFIGGALVILGGISYLRVAMRSPPRPPQYR